MAGNTAYNLPVHVWKIRLTDMVKVAESPNYGDGCPIYDLTEDEEFVYCAGYGTQKVWKLNKTDMSKISESTDYGGTINALDNDENYIYCAGFVTNTVWQIWKSNMTKKAESASYGDRIYSLTVDDNYIYCGGLNIQEIWKIQKSDMSKIDEIADVGYGIIADLIDDADYLYCAGQDHCVWKIQKSDMTKVGQSAEANGNFNGLTEDNNYIYGSANTYSYSPVCTVWKIQKSDMDKVDESARQSSFGAVADDSTYVYCGTIYVPLDNALVWKMEKETMDKVDEGDYYGPSGTGSVVTLSTTATSGTHPPPPYSSNSNGVNYLQSIEIPDMDSFDFNFSNIVEENGFLSLGFGVYVALFGDFFWGLFFGVIGVAIYAWKSNTYSLIGYLIAVLIFTRVILPVGLADLMAILLGLAAAGLVYRVFIKKKQEKEK